MAADEEIAGHEIAGEDVPSSPILPPTTDPADTCEAYAEIEFAGECIPASGIVYPDLTIHGDTCDAYAEIEYAGACVNPDAIFNTLPTSSVEEFDTSVGRLGCGTPTIFITSRCAQTMTCQIDLADVTKLTWTRVLDNVSEAEVEIGLTGDSEQTCCQCLAIVEPFCHELHIWRDGEEVWVGPIEAIRYERERVTIKARDSLAWFDVRIPNEDVEFSTLGTTGVVSDNPLTAGSATMNSPDFAVLPAVVAGVPFIELVLDETNETNKEYIYILTHGAGATSASIVRAQHGTSAKAHVQGSPWRVQGFVYVDNPLLAASTTLNGAYGMSDLPVVTASDPAIFIVLDPFTPSAREVVQIVTHTAAATSATIARAQRGTQAINHTFGNPWNAGGVSGPAEDLAFMAKDIMNMALEEDINIGNTCEFANIFLSPTGEIVEFYKEAFNETYLEVLLALAETELNITTLGRTIVINGDSLSLTPLGLLNDEHIMGDIEVTKDGKFMANRIYIHYEGDQGIPEVGQKDEDQRYCYSLIERIKDGNGLQVAEDAQVTADSLVNASFIAPRIIEIPEGSRLSPDTPWTINQLVPGARVDVAITRLCLKLTQSFLLIGVTAEYSNEGEAIGVTLRPMNSASTG